MIFEFCSLHSDCWAARPGLGDFPGVEEANGGCEPVVPVDLCPGGGGEACRVSVSAWEAAGSGGLVAVIF